MKKIIPFLAVAVFTAVSAQATSVKWSASSIKDENGNKITGAAAYVFVTADTKDSPATTVIDRDTIVAKIQAGDTSVLSSATATASVTSLGGISATFDGGWSEGQKVTAFLVIYDSANPSGSAKAIITDNLTTTLGNMGTTASNFGAQGSATWTAVPEPTAVALLAIGLVALGLKRKVA